MKKKRNGKRAKRKNGKKRNGKYPRLNTFFHFLLCNNSFLFCVAFCSVLGFMFITH